MSLLHFLQETRDEIRLIILEAVGDNNIKSKHVGSGNRVHPLSELHAHLEIEMTEEIFEHLVQKQGGGDMASSN